MKHCGQWLSLLWVSLTLLCPPIHASAALVADTIAFNFSDVRNPASLPSLDNFVLPEFKKSGDKKTTSPGHPPSVVFAEPPPARLRPALVRLNAAALATTRSPAPPPAGELPPSCGPPAQA